MPDHSFSRRALLAASAALPLAGLAGQPARAATHAVMARSCNARSFTVGELSVATLLAGAAMRPDPHRIFGLDVDDATFAAVSAANFIPADRAKFYFTPTLVRDSTNTVLFDTGLNAAGITAALADAGLGPGDVTHVVVTHMHPDHIGGLMNEGTPTFANATCITGRVEFDAWAKAGNDLFEANVRPLADRMTFVEDGESPLPGLTALAAFGHTPGHMTWMIESAGRQLLIAADLANHYVWSLGYPDWEVRFDRDKAAAAASRRRILGMLAADRLPMIGYHMPYPGMGFVEPRGEGFRWVPVSYQFD